MRDNEMLAPTKPAEMSFSDWKKLKNALNTSVETTAAKRNPPQRKPTINANNNNFYNDSHTEYRKPQSLLYFGQLKQNNQRIYGGGFCNNQPIPHVPFFNRHPSPNSMMGNFSQQHARPNYFNSQPGPNNNNFMMPRGCIPQQPFPVNNHLNSKRMGNSFRFTDNKQASSNTQRRVVTKHKVANISSPVSNATKEITTTSTTSSSQVEPELANENQDTAKVKTKKQKRWNVRPPKPPTLIAITPESKEEKQRMWREYRQKMKPFKNRDFHNAKRVVQRLSKKNFDELEERDKDRLARAKETVDAHKAMLTEKSRRWTLANDSTSNPTTTSIFVSTPSGVYTDATVVPPLPQPVENTALSSSIFENENEPKQKKITINPTNQWSLWNNFVPSGVIFNSIGK